MAAGDRGAARRLAGHRRIAQVPAAVVVVVAVAALARSGATTTRTSAVPMVLTGAAVVYGSTAEGGRWRVAATARRRSLLAGHVVDARRGHVGRGVDRGLHVPAGHLQLVGDGAGRAGLARGVGHQHRGLALGLGRASWWSWWWIPPAPSWWGCSARWWSVRSTTLTPPGSACGSARGAARWPGRTAPAGWRPGRWGLWAPNAPGDGVRAPRDRPLPSACQRRGGEASTPVPVGGDRTLGPVPAGRERAGVAQLAEQTICNRQVVGSIPTAGSVRRGRPPDPPAAA